jgi:hypothetical protein
MQPQGKNDAEEQEGTERRIRRRRRRRKRRRAKTGQMIKLRHCLGT